MRCRPYEPGDWMWRVNRERVLLLAGPRALLLQLAHPLVAAGVDAHARFRADPLGRLRRTLDTMLSLIFGPREVGAARAAEVGRLHARVQGRLPVAVGDYAAGTPYDAADPVLLAWVHGTLIDSALVAYEAFVEPLPPEARAAFYRESKRMAAPFGLEPEGLPPSIDDFERELQAWLEGPQLCVGACARRLAEDVLHPPLRGLPRFVTGPSRSLTFGLLPEPVRRGYGVHWSASDERRHARRSRWLRRALPWLPARLRVMAPARRAERIRHLSASDDPEGAGRRRRPAAPQTPRVAAPGDRPPSGASGSPAEPDSRGGS